MGQAPSLFCLNAFGFTLYPGIVFCFSFIHLFFNFLSFDLDIGSNYHLDEPLSVPTAVDILPRLLQHDSLSLSLSSLPFPLPLILSPLCLICSFIIYLFIWLFTGLSYAQIVTCLIQLTCFWIPSIQVQNQPYVHLASNGADLQNEKENQGQVYSRSPVYTVNTSHWCFNTQQRHRTKFLLLTQAGSWLISVALFSQLLSTVKALRPAANFILMMGRMIYIVIDILQSNFLCRKSDTSKIMVLCIKKNKTNIFLI